MELGWVCGMCRLDDYTTQHPKGRRGANLGPRQGGQAKHLGCVLPPASWARLSPTYRTERTAPHSCHCARSQRPSQNLQLPFPAPTAALGSFSPSAISNRHYSRIHGW